MFFQYFINGFVRQKKKHELMQKFFDLNLKEMKFMVDQQIETFLKRKKQKMSAALKTNLEKCRVFTNNKYLLLKIFYRPKAQAKRIHSIESR